MTQRRVITSVLKVVSLWERCFGLSSRKETAISDLYYEPLLAVSRKHHNQSCLVVVELNSRMKIFQRRLARLIRRGEDDLINPVVIHYLDGNLIKFRNLI